MNMRVSMPIQPRGGPGPAGPSPEYDTDGVRFRFRQPNGEWGPWINPLGADGPDGTRQTFRTVAHATASIISGGVEGITTQGYWTVGDGGGASYIEVFGAPVDITSADGRKWRLVINEFTNLRQFGVKPDGVFNSNAYYQTGINRLCPVLNFPAGTILVDGSGIFGVSDQVWRGAGIDATIIKLTANTAQEMVVWVGKSRVEIHGMTFDYNNKTPTGNLSVVNFTNCSDVLLRRVGVKSGTFLGITCNNVSRVTIEDCRIERDAVIGTQNQAIQITGAVNSGYRIAGNRMKNWACLFGNLTDAVICDNYIDGFRYGSGFGCGGVGSTDADITWRNNTIINGSDQKDSDDLRPYAMELHCIRSTVDGCDIRNNGGGGIDSRGEGMTIINNRIINNGQRQLIAPGEKYAGIKVQRTDPSKTALRTMVRGNYVHTDNVNLQAYGLWIEGSVGSPADPQYLAISDNWFYGGEKLIQGDDGNYKSFTGGAIIAKASYDPPSLTTGNRSTCTIAVVGVDFNDKVIASFSADTQGIDVRPRVSAINEVKVDFVNDVGSTINLAAGTVTLVIWKDFNAAKY